METREHGGIDKRLSRIDRWLKRCMAACRCGSWSSALMEIECMEAETREFREALWDIAAEEAEGKIRRPLRASAFLGARVVVLALAIVMAVGLPLSVDQDRPFGGFASRGNSVAVLTSTESDILDALRASLSNRNADRVVLTLDRTGDEETATLSGSAVAAEEGPSRGAVPARGVRQPGARSSKSGDVKGLSAVTAPADTPAQRTPPKEPSVEEVISLIQVGQRALQISEPAIKVVP